MTPLLNYLNLVPSSAFLAVAGFKMRRHPQEKRWTMFLVVSFLIIVTVMLTGNFLKWSGHTFTVRYDDFLFRLDQPFGQPSFAMAKMAERLPRLYGISMLAYCELYGAMSLVIGFYFLTQPLREVKIVLRTFLLSLLALFFYVLLPASGPSYAFGGFPRLPASAPHILHLTAPPNCMPSVHLTLALLILYFLWPWKAGRLFGSVYLMLIAFAALASGEHYFIDLLIAFPFTAVLVYLGGASIPETADDILLQDAGLGGAGLRGGRYEDYS
jgi:hypothetical protein